MSLKHKITFAMMALVLGVVLGSGWVAYVGSANILRAKTYGHLYSTAAFKKQHIGSIIAENERVFNAMASKFQLRQSLVAYESNEGRQQAAEIMTKILNAAVDADPLISLMSVAGLDGGIVASTVKAEVGQDKLTLMGIARMEIAPQAAVTAVSSVNESEIELVVTGPLEMDGKVIGYLTMRSSANPILNSVHGRDGLGATGEVIVARRLPNGDAQFIFPLRFDENASMSRTVPAGGRKLPIHRALNRENELLHHMTDYRDVEVLAVTEFIPGVNWGLVVKIDTSEALQPLATLQQFFAWLFAVSVIVAIGFAYVVSTSVTRPILRLSTAAQGISSGTIETLPENDRSDEIGTLSRSLKTMLDNLTESGTRLKAVTISRDELSREINARKRAENQIRLLLDATAEAIYGIDVDGNCTFCNQSCITMLGYDDPQDLLGKHMLDLIHHTRPDGTTCPWTECLTYKAIREGEGTHADDEVLWRQDGSSFPAEYWSFPIREDDAVTGAVVTFLDITERRRAERALKDSNAELEAANMELDAFAYAVSHDLRAPLRAMDGFSRSLIEDYGEKLDGGAKDYLDRIRAAAQRMGQLIDDLLSLSRINRQNIQKRSVDLSHMAREIEDQLRTAEPDRDVTVDIASGLSTMTDGGLARVIMANTLGNAWKFSQGTAGARIEFGVTKANGTPAFFVRDNGVGFDMAYAEKLFQPFQRLHSDRRFEGTGIGLATVARAVGRLNGRIWAESELGKGATIYFTL